MKKIVYAIALLGALPLFQSCIDDSESLSVKEVREAKAEQLQSMADLNKANADAQLKIAEAEVEARKAEAQLSLANAELVKAQAALVAVQAQLEQVNVQIAQTQLEEEKVELEKKKVELQVAQSNYQLIVAQNEYLIQKYKNDLDLLAKQLEVQMQNLANQLLMAQTEALRQQMEYDKMLNDKELADAFATQRKLNAYIIEFQQASTNLYTQQGNVFDLELKYKLIESELVDAEEAYAANVNAAITNKNNYLFEIAGLTAQLNAYEQYADATLEELKVELQQAEVALINANHELLIAQNAELEAQDQYDEDALNLSNSIYYVEGVRPLLNAGVGNYFYIDGENPFETTYEEDEDGNLTVTNYYGFVHEVEDQVGTTNTTYKWEIDTIFVDAVKYVNVQADPNPEVTGVEPSYNFGTTYQQVETYYEVYSETALNEFISWYGENNKGDLNGIPVTEEYIEYLQGVYDQETVAMKDIEAAYKAAQNIYNTDNAQWEKVNAQADKLYAAYEAAIDKNNSVQVTLQQLSDAVVLYQDRAINLEYGKIFPLENNVIPGLKDDIFNYQTAYDNYKDQLAAATDPMDKEYYQYWMDYYQELITENEAALKQAEADLKEYQGLLTSTNTQLTAAQKALDDFVKANPDAADDAYEAWWNYVTSVAYTNAQENYNTAYAHLEYYEGLYFQQQKDLEAALNELNEAKAILAGEDPAEFLEAAVEVLKEQATNVANLVAAANESAVALADAELVKHNAEAVQTEAFETYITIYDLVYGAPQNFDGSVNIPQMIASLQEQIASYEELVAECDKIIDTPFQPEGFNYYLSLYQAQLNEAKALLEMYQSIYDEAKANLDKVYEEFGSTEK